MSEQDEKQTRDDTQSPDNEQKHEPDAPTPEAQLVADLREMQKSSDHLDKTIDDARNAVQAAHNANTMGSAGDSNVPDSNTPDSNTPDSSTVEPE